MVFKCQLPEKVHEKVPGPLTGCKAQTQPRNAAQQPRHPACQGGERTSPPLNLAPRPSLWSRASQGGGRLRRPLKPNRAQEQRPQDTCSVPT